MGHDETLPEGSYLFTVVDATERTSQSGNTMIELELMVKGPDGKNGIRLYDHLTFIPKSLLEDRRVQSRHWRKPCSWSDGSIRS